MCISSFAPPQNKLSTRENLYQSYINSIYDIYCRVPATKRSIFNLNPCYNRFQGKTVPISNFKLNLKLSGYIILTVTYESQFLPNLLLSSSQTFFFCVIPFDISEKLTVLFRPIFRFHYATFNYESLTPIDFLTVFATYSKIFETFPYGSQDPIHFPSLMVKFGCPILEERVGY